MKIFLGADHGGYKYKEELKKFLIKNKYSLADVGNTAVDPQDDYPVFAFKMARQVAQTRDGRGIFICRSGAGGCIAANKVKGIRACQAFNLRSAKMSRVDDDANVLCLGADYISLAEAKKMVAVWLKTKFSASARHHRRVNMIKRAEK
ncbi:MAG: RpiB/LacA/LacB family sugar-phosphate isomerase [Patescibacteria group bacterium]|jgi:ribose 5-phosphate isomerase B